MYGNYDGLNSPPVFDLYAGVNFWTTVNLTGIDFESQEAIVVVPDNFVQVCLINTGSGTPFISGLNLRPLKTYLYPQVNATQGLVLFARRNFGQTDGIHVRYPDDPHDRIWVPWFDATIWDVVSTMQRVQNYEMDRFEAPSKVMQTAITPRNASKNIEFVWNSMMSHKDRSLPGYMLITHFSELNLLTSSDVREFNINLNGELWWSHLRPRYLYSDAIYSTKPLRSDTRYKVSINATANSTLPPIINAVEIFSIISTTNVGTDSQDVSAMMVIKAEYQVKKNWMGDPCAAQTYAWDGLTCTYAAAPSPPRITGVNMSFTGLNGNVSSTFANLKAVQFLYLSHNNLNGSIPDALSQLPSLKVLDLTGNQLSGSIPPGLLKKIQDGSLNLIYADNPNLCTNGNSCPTAKGKSKLAIYIALPVALAVMVVLIFCLLMLKKTRISEQPCEASEREADDRPCANRRRARGQVTAASEPSVHIQGPGDDHEQLPACDRPGWLRIRLRGLLGGWHSGSGQTAVSIVQSGCQGVPRRGTDLNTGSSQESCLHDRLLQGRGVHGTCGRVHVRRHPAGAHCTKKLNLETEAPNRTGISARAGVSAHELQPASHSQGCEDDQHPTQ
ncbi:unnamed protein product [Urochloa humidicola]